VGDVQAVSCGYHIPSGSHADFAPIDVLVEVLTNEPSGRLYKALVESKKASTQWGFAYSLKNPGFVYFNADVLKEKSITDARTAMMNVMDELSTKAITAEEVERAKNKLLKDIELSLNNSGRVGINLSEYIAQGDWRLFFIHRDAIEKTTVDDVNRVAKSYFKPSNRTAGMFIPEAKPDRSEIPASPELTALTKDYKGKKALADAETFDPSPTNIDARTKKGKIDGGAQYAFLAKATRGSNVNVNITLRIGTEKTLENKSTIANLTAAMLNRGTKTKTREQISDAFDKLKAQVSFWGYGQSVSVNINTTKENLGGTLKLVTEILRQPNFPAGEFDKLKDEELSNIEQQRSDPQSLAYNTYSRITNPYPKGHFKYKMNFDEQVEATKSAKADDLKQFYNNFYGSAGATVALVGDFDETTALTGLKAMLAGWKAPQKYERTPSPFFDVAAKNENINTPDKKNASLQAGMNLKLRDDDPDYAGLVIGDFMFGGGFLNSRLATRIRQKEGVSYGVGSWIWGSSFEQAGGFGSYAIYNPDNADKLINAYKEELAKMLKDGFTEAELKDAKSGYLQEQKVNRSRDRSLAYKLSDNLFLNRSLKWEGELDTKINNLKVEQVNAAMRKFISPEKIIYVQAGDFKTK
jgi:zinc protease